MSNYFDLEQELMECWGVTKDLDILNKAMDRKKLSVDSISNILLGIHDLIELKYENLYQTISENNNNLLLEKVKETELVVKEVSNLFKSVLDSEMDYSDIKKELDLLIEKNDNRFQIAWDVFSDLVNNKKFKF